MRYGTVPVEKEADCEGSAIKPVVLALLARGSDTDESKDGAVRRRSLGMSSTVSHRNAGWRTRVATSTIELPEPGG